MSSKQSIKLYPHYYYYRILNLLADENNICIFCGATEKMQPKSLRFEIYRSHTIRRTHTLDRTPLNEWSVCRRGRYLHNTQQTQEMTSAGFEPVMPGIKQLQTYALDPTATTMRIIPYLIWDTLYLTLLHYHYHHRHIQSAGIWQIFFRLGKVFQVLLLASKWYPISLVIS